MVGVLVSPKFVKIVLSPSFGSRYLAAGADRFVVNGVGFVDVLSFIKRVKVFLLLAVAADLLHWEMGHVSQIYCL